MKKLLLILVAFTISLSLFAQTPFTFFDFENEPEEQEGEVIFPSAYGEGNISFIGGITYTIDAGFNGSNSLNTRDYPNQSSGSQTAGIEINVGTTDHEHIVVSWYQRTSPAAAKHTRVQYTIDGETWVNFNANSFNAVNINMTDSTHVEFKNGLFVTYPENEWLLRAVNFVDIPEVNDNEFFAVRILTSFAPNTNLYEPVNPNFTYLKSGTQRFDDIAVSDYMPAIFAIAPENGNGLQNSPYEIATLENLYWISQHSERWNKHYIQVEDIDASDTQLLNDILTDNSIFEGWSPIGNEEIPFTGSYNGDEKIISGLYINRAKANFVGFFGNTSSANVRNVVIEDAVITGNDFVGTITGNKLGGNFVNIQTSANISGNQMVGGISGYSSIGNMRELTTHGTIQATLHYVGGITGYLLDGIITESYSTCTVSSTGDYTAGLVAYADLAEITNSYTTGNVNGNKFTAGLISYLNSGSVSKSYSTGNVTGTHQYTAGLVAYSKGNIDNSYTMGSITGTQFVGGLAGYTHFANISNSYTTSTVSGGGYTGRLIGRLYSGNIAYCVYETNNSENELPGVGFGYTLGVHGRTTDEMKIQSTYTDLGWNFDIPDGIWKIGYHQDPEDSEADPILMNDGYPVLRWQEYKTSNNDLTIATQAIKNATLHAAYPNPFNPTTTISFDLTKANQVNLVVYNIKGQKVKTLADNYFTAGNHKVVWNGKDENNNTVASGMYFYKMQTNDFVQVNKVMMIK